MLTEIDIKKTREKGYLVETGLGWMINEYFIIYLLVMISLVLGFKVYVDEFKFETGTTERIVFFSIFLLFVVATIYTFYKIQLNKKFITIKTGLIKTENRTLIENLLKEENWSCFRINQHYFIADIPAKWLTRQEVTVLIDENQIRVNVRPAPGTKGRSPFSFGRAKKTLRKIEKRITTPSNTIQNRQLHP